MQTTTLPGKKAGSLIERRLSLTQKVLIITLHKNTKQANMDLIQSAKFLNKVCHAANKLAVFSHHRQTVLILFKWS